MRFSASLQSCSIKKGTVETIPHQEKFEICKPIRLIHRFIDWLFICNDLTVKWTKLKSMPILEINATHVEIASSMGAGGIYHVIVDKYYNGQIMKSHNGWRVQLASYNYT